MQKLVQKRLKELKNYPKVVGPVSLEIEDIHTGVWRYHRPVIDHEKCIKCGICKMYCPTGVIEINEKTTIDYTYCKGCGICANECPKDAISMQLESEIVKEEA